MHDKTKKVVRVGLIGSGGIAATHLEALARIPKAELVAVYSRRKAQIQELIAASAFEESNDITLCDSLESFLSEDLGLDAVLVATPSGAHAEAIMPAIRAGKHVLCEKPLEISSARIKEMLAAAKEAGVVLAGLLPLRVGDGARAIHEAIEQGRFGQLTMLSARIKWWRETAYYTDSTWRGTQALDGGGALMNQGIHAVDLLLWLGGKVKQVSAFSAKLVHKEIEVEDTLSGTLHYENGALGTITAATSCYPGLDFSVEISGEQGTAVLVNDKIEFWRFAEERPEDEAIRSGEMGGKVRGGTADPKAISCEGHRQQIAAFCQALIEESTKGVILGPEAGQAVALVEATYRSATSGQSEQVEYYNE